VSTIYPRDREIETLLNPVPVAETATEWLLLLSEIEIAPLMLPEADHAQPARLSSSAKGRL
jgi:hypothetical protein